MGAAEVLEDEISDGLLDGISLLHLDSRNTKSVSRTVAVHPSCHVIDHHTG